MSSVLITIFVISILVNQDEGKLRKTYIFKCHISTVNDHRKAGFHICHFLRRSNKLNNISLESEMVMKILPLNHVDFT
jgi:hypothetical protein